MASSALWASAGSYFFNSKRLTPPPPARLRIMAGMNWSRPSLTLRTWVLAWFMASLGMAIASPIVHPQSFQLVCSASGAVMLMAQGDDGAADPMGASGMDCPLCAPGGAPPSPDTATAAPPQPLAHALRPVPAARIAAATAAPLPARGPPLPLL